MKNIIAIILFNSLLLAQNIYVSPSGSDDNNGTIERPFATIERAKAAVRDALAATDDDITVYLRGGTYRLKQAVVFDPVDGGKDKQRVIYRNYEGEEPIISSGVRVELWKKLESGNLYVADIPQGIDKFYSLYDRIYRLPRARGKGFKPVQGAKDPGISKTELHYPEGVILKSWDNITDVEIFIRPWCLWSMNILPLAKVDEENRIAYTALEGSYPLTRERIERFGAESVWVENAIEELDEPGEWVVNTLTRKIYLWPKSDIAASEIYVPALREYFCVKGDENKQLPVRNLTFEGLTFVHGDRDVWTKDEKGVQHDWEMYDKDNAMLRLRWAQDCQVSRCAFVGAASTGLRLDLYAQNITVKDNMFAYLGGSGVVLCGYGPGNKDFNKNNTIINNHIHHIGELYWHNSAILLFQSGGNRIAHNLLHDTPYNAISIGGAHPPVFDRMKGSDSYDRELQRTVDTHACRKVLAMERKTYWKDILPFIHGSNNVVEYNEIHNALKILGDGNGIYIRMVPAGNIIRRNYLHDIDGFGAAIRADDDQFGCRINENVIYNCSYAGITIKKQNEVSNNIIVNITMKRDKTKDTVEEPSGYLTFRLASKSSKNLDAPKLSEAILRNNILYHTLNYAPVFYTDINPNYPADYYREVLETLCAPDVDRGLIYWSRDKNNFVNDYIAQIREVRGDDHNSIIADPMFVNAAGGDFRFKPGSPALKLGIKEIDVREIGLTKDFPKEFEKYGK